MAKMGADLDNFYQLLKAIKNRLNLYKGADYLLKINPKK